MLRCECCKLNLQHLDEKKRDLVMEKFALLINEQSTKRKQELMRCLVTLETDGYDVSSYKNALRDTIHA